MKALILVFVASLACVGCGAGPVVDTRTQDEAAIRALEDRFVTAFNARDLNAVMAAYTPDEGLVVFDANPPLQYRGVGAYRKDFADFFAAYPGGAHITVSELEITVGGDVAYSHCIQHTTMTDKSGKKAETTVRVTDGYKKVKGVWLISHEHVSLPVDMETMRGMADAK